MSHALIIEQDVPIARELSRRLSALGFTSVDHVWNDDDTVLVASKRSPDLVLVGDHVGEGSSPETVHNMCEDRGVPMLLVTADSLRIGERIADGAILKGPFAFSQFSEAVQEARKAATCLMPA